MFNSETKICQNCKSSFLIGAQDFQFYERFQVPPPKKCPDCRQQLRYAWRNERVLYRRNCDLCGKSIVTIYSLNKPFKVYCSPCWWSDKWGGSDFGREFDFSRPFFDQFRELQLAVPRIALLTKNSVGSEYTNHSSNNRNCYLSFSVFDAENILYSTNIWKGAKDCVDCYLATNEGGAELSYECIDSYNIYQCQYGGLLRDCRNCFYCFDLRGCSDCFLSANLRSKRYHFLNEACTKEEYEERVRKFNLGSAQDRRKLYDQWLTLIRDKALHRFAQIEKSSNVSGNMINNSRNAHHAFDADQLEDARYAIIAPDIKTSMDSYHYGLRCELIYESHAIIHSYNLRFTHLSYDNSHLTYCDSCHNSENLFGCVGIKNGNHLIFNRQYAPDEYNRLMGRIIEHMRATGEYGEFFPPQLSPFGYNETQGQVYMPMSKEEALSKGYAWEDLLPGTFGKETITRDAIPDDIKSVRDSITQEVLACTLCKRNFNIVEPELVFYRRENIPIPQLCPECRYRQRLALRPPRKLWPRQYMCDYEIYKSSISHPHHKKGRCPNEFETSYAPERKEVVYCEQCYQAEVV